MKLFLCFCSGVLLGNFAYATTMDSTEVSIGEFSEFVASSGLITHAEQYGGMVYEGGWVVKPNWNWRAPYGEIGVFDEPAVHVTYAEAEKLTGVVPSAYQTCLLGNTPTTQPKLYSHNYL